jgi:selenide,water dikinase
VPEARRRLVCDATTSGGLLVALAPQRVAGLPGPVVGEIVAGAPGAIAVE